MGTAREPSIHVTIEAVVGLHLCTCIYFEDEINKADKVQDNNKHTNLGPKF